MTLVPISSKPLLIECPLCKVLTTEEGAFLHLNEFHKEEVLAALNKCVKAFRRLSTAAKEASVSLNRLMETEKIDE